VKTYVLDASALFSFLQKKPSAFKVNQLLKEASHGRTDILISAVNYGEVYGGIFRKHGYDEAVATMSAIQPLPIQVVDINAQRAFRAAEVKSRFKLYYVDSFAAALAMEYKATLVTGDSDFRCLGHNVSVLWLKN
jgi:predicted nucleic acid-binding protein